MVLAMAMLDDLSIYVIMVTSSICVSIYLVYFNVQIVLVSAQDSAASPSMKP